MPAEEETKGMPESYQRKHRCGDEGKYVVSFPTSIYEEPARTLKFPRRCQEKAFKQRLGSA